MYTTFIVVCNQLSYSCKTFHYSILFTFFTPFSKLAGIHTFSRMHTSLNDLLKNKNWVCTPIAWHKATLPFPNFIHYHLIFYSSEFCQILLKQTDPAVIAAFTFVTFPFVQQNNNNIRPIVQHGCSLHKLVKQVPQLLSKKAML